MKIFEQKLNLVKSSIPWCKIDSDTVMQFREAFDSENDVISNIHQI